MSEAVEAVSDAEEGRAARVYMAQVLVECQQPCQGSLIIGARPALFQLRAAQQDGALVGIACGVILFQGQGIRIGCLRGCGFDLRQWPESDAAKSAAGRAE